MKEITDKIKTQTNYLPKIISINERNIAGNKYCRKLAEKIPTISETFEEKLITMKLLLKNLKQHLNP